MKGTIIKEFRQSLMFFSKELTDKFNWKVFSLAFFAIIFTFPLVELSYGAGIDEPLMWVFNYLFHGNIELGKDIIFPHGPLAFFMYPLKENFILSLFVKVVLQFVLIFQIFNLTVRNNERHENWLLSILFSIILLKICNLNLLIIVTNSALYLNSYNSNNKQKKYLAYAITAFAFYIRSYVAILSGVIAFSFIVSEYFRKRNIIETIKDVAIIWGLILLLWILMYHSFSGFFRYCFGVINLAQDNSSAAAYYPENNWWYLVVFIVPLILIPFFNKSEKVRFYVCLLALSIFAAWKHGMSREDIAHARGFFFLLFCFAILFFLFTKRHTLRNFGLIGISLIGFYINLTNVYSYSSVSFEFSGVNNFVDFLQNYSGIKQHADDLTKKSLQENILPDSVVKLIGKESVDVYPWDYSIIPANNLRWQPRPVIQSYAAYTHWLDNENSKHFESKKAATFLIWQLNKVSKNIMSGSFESIDGRYLLNDEPNTIISILCNYAPVYKDEKFIVYKKRTVSQEIKINTVAKTRTTWDKWTETPINQSDLTRVKVKIHGNILRKIKSFLYKDEFFYIYCKMEDSSIVKWRIVPKNAEDGLWINPMIFDPSNKPLKVVSVLFKNSNARLFKDNIDLEWVNYQFINNSNIENYPIYFFNSDSIIQHKTLYKSSNSFESTMPNWKTDTVSIIKSSAYHGNRSVLLQPGAFSSTFTLNLDTIQHSSLLISANCWMKRLTRKTPMLKFVISVDSKTENIIWNAINSVDQMVDNKWNVISNGIYYENNVRDRYLSVYVLNTSSVPVCIDDIEVVIKAKDE